MDRCGYTSGQMVEMASYGFGFGELSPLRTIMRDMP